MTPPPILVHRVRYTSLDDASETRTAHFVSAIEARELAVARRLGTSPAVVEALWLDRARALRVYGIKSAGGGHVTAGRRKR